MLSSESIFNCELLTGWLKLILYVMFFALSISSFVKTKSLPSILCSSNFIHQSNKVVLTVSIILNNLDLENINLKSPSKPVSILNILSIP